LDDGEDEINRPFAKKVKNEEKSESSEDEEEKDRRYDEERKEVKVRFWHEIFCWLSDIDLQALSDRLRAKDDEKTKKVGGPGKGTKEELEETRKRTEMYQCSTLACYLSLSPSLAVCVVCLDMSKLFLICGYCSFAAAKAGGVPSETIDRLKEISRRIYVKDREEKMLWELKAEIADEEQLFADQKLTPSELVELEIKRKILAMVQQRLQRQNQKQEGYHVPRGYEDVEGRKKKDDVLEARYEPEEYVVRGHPRFVARVFVCVSPFLVVCVALSLKRNFRRSMSKVPGKTTRHALLAWPLAALANAHLLKQRSIYAVPVSTSFEVLTDLFFFADMSSSLRTRLTS
jgi:hypothetical protein